VAAAAAGATLEGAVAAIPASYTEAGAIFALAVISAPNALIKIQCLGLKKILQKNYLGSHCLSPQ